jgi:hypothetical protein
LTASAEKFENRSLIPAGVPASSVGRVEVEIYHVFPLDSDAARTPSVPTRTNSSSDVEIDAATRDSDEGTLRFITTDVSTFAVQNTVINGINKAPAQTTHGEGPATGEQVEIDITFNPPLFLPPGHYFFRPEAEVSGGNFLLLSAPRPITSGTPFPVGTTDLQSWIRNANLAPDWLRIGTDIIGSDTFNMTFSLTRNTIPEAGTPGRQTATAAQSLQWLMSLGGSMRPPQPWDIPAWMRFRMASTCFAGSSVGPSLRACRGLSSSLARPRMLS